MRTRSKAVEIPEMTQAMLRYLASRPPPPPPAPVVHVMDPLFTAADVSAEAEAEAEGE